MLRHNNPQNFTISLSFPKSHRSNHKLNLQTIKLVMLATDPNSGMIFQQKNTSPTLEIRKAN